MTRKLCSVLTVLLCVAGFRLALADPSSAQSVIPHHGVYQGTDDHGRTVSFSFGGHNQLTHFTVGGHVIGGAHVSHGMWHETCHGGMCFKGQWTRDGHVTGAWRHGGSHHWTHWRADFNPPSHPYVGHYMGRDHRDLRIEFSYNTTHHLVNFKLDHNLIGGATVTNRHFATCHHNVCFKGHWQTDHYVVGSWRYSNSHEWHGWEANAFSS